MKAKNSLRGLLWPLIKQYTKLKYRLLGTRKPQNTTSNLLKQQTREIAAESKRIAEKLRQTKQLAGGSWEDREALNRIPPEEDAGKENSRLRCGWREDEDDRYSSKDYAWRYHRPNRMCEDNREIMKAVLHAFFKADHDAMQFEQYQLENDRALSVRVQEPANRLKRFVNSGLKMLITVSLIMAVSSVKVKAQGSAQALKIGDQVPDITIQNIVNYPGSTAKISDFKGKLLILDFWASWCAVCIPSLSQLDTLQQQFGEQIMVLPVSNQPTEQIRAFVKKKGWKLPSVTASNELEQLFPHRSVPHQVWIRDGVVKSITAHFSATAANIRAVLDDQPVELLGKNDKMDFDAAKPMMLNGNGGPVKKLNYQSLITGYMDGLGYTTSFTDGIIQVTNNSALYLYSRALEKQYPWLRYKNRTILEVPDTLRNIVTPPAGLKGEVEARWYIRNGYCYNLVMPPATSAKEMAKLMHTDLNRFFNVSLQLNGDIERVRTKCLVLKRTGDKDLLKSSNGLVAYSRTPGQLLMRNKPFKVFVDVLTFEYSKSPMPLVDESNYTGPADLELSGSLKDLPALRKELKKYGLSIEEHDRELDMLVIRNQMPAK